MDLGWPRDHVIVIDLTAQVALGHVGLVLGPGVSSSISVAEKQEGAV